MQSIGRYGDSPFIYPVYGLSGLAEGFSRLCALYQGTYMLNRDVEDILVDDKGKFIGIKSQGEVILLKYIGCLWRNFGRRTIIFTTKKQS